MDNFFKKITPKKIENCEYAEELDRIQGTLIRCKIFNLFYRIIHHQLQQIW